MRESTSCAAFILAGGKSTRMGSDKAFVTLNGQTLLERALGVAGTVTLNVKIVGSAAKFQSFAPVVEDVFPGCGPLAGIHAGLRSSESDLNLALAVDLPFVTDALLRYLIGVAAGERDAVVTVPRTSAGWQPVCAVYRREFGDDAETALQRGNFKIDSLFRQVHVRTVDEEELATAGFVPTTFGNVNTREELEAAGELLKSDSFQGNARRS